MVAWVWEGITQAGHTEECQQDSYADNASLLLTACWARRLQPAESEAYNMFLIHIWLEQYVPFQA